MKYLSLSRGQTGALAKGLASLLVSSAIVMATLVAPMTASAAQTTGDNSGGVQSAIVATGNGWVIVGSGYQVSNHTIHFSAPTKSGALRSHSYILNCGWITCSIYYSRSTTKQLNKNILLDGGGLGALALQCSWAAFAGPIGVAAGIACGTVVVLGGSFLLNAISRAAGSDYCLRIRFPIPLAFYSDNSGYCEN